jgi:hypothetical protein
MAPASNASASADERRGDIVEGYILVPQKQEVKVAARLGAQGWEREPLEDREPLAREFRPRDATRVGSA